MMGDRMTPQWRCALCGRFMKWEADVVDVSIADGWSMEPPDPEMAHRECNSDRAEMRGAR